MAAANSAHQSNANSMRTNLNTMDDFPDDDFLNDIDIDQIASKVTNVAAPVAAHTSNARHDSTIPPNHRSTLLFDDMDDNDFLNIDSTIDLLNPMPKNDSIQCEVPSRNEVASTSAVHLRSPEPTIAADTYRFKIRGLNLVTIKQLNDCLPNDRLRRRHFITKAFIESIVQKARISKNQWKLNVSLTDQFSMDVTMTVAFSPDVLDKLAGISGREVSQMFTKKSENPQLEIELNQILEGLCTTLNDLNTFMKIAFVENAELPIVVELIAAAPVLDRKLLEKVQYEQLN